MRLSFEGRRDTMKCDSPQVDLKKKEKLSEVKVLSSFTRGFAHICFFLQLTFVRGMHRCLYNMTAFSTITDLLCL